MARFFDPNADGASNAWSKSSGTTGWNLIDDAIRQPSTPDTADHVNEVTANDLQDVLFASGTYAAGTWTLWVYGAGGTKRKIQYAINTGGGFGAFADLFLAGEAAGWKSVDVSSNITSQSTLDNFEIRFKCVQTAGGGGATAVFVYATYLEGPDLSSPTRGRISWTEAEAPLVPTRGQVSWAEAETPLAPTRGRIAWAESEAPLAPTRGRLSWTEAEAPSVATPTRGLISFAESEAPLAATRGRIAWAEAETSLVPTRGLVSHAQAEAPLATTRGLTSWSEFEAPAIATRGRISFVEFEAPQVSSSTRPRAIHLSAGLTTQI